MFGLAARRVNKGFSAVLKTAGTAQRKGDDMQRGWPAGCRETAAEAAPAASQAARLIRIAAVFMGVWLWWQLWFPVLRVLIEVPASRGFFRTSDFATMWHAGWLLRHGDVAALYDGNAFLDWLNRRHGAGPAPVLWIYPPTMDVVAMMVAALPLGAGFWLYRAAAMVADGVLLRLAGLQFPVLLAGIFGPVEVRDLVLGQNGVLTGGLLVGCLLLLPARPRIAGICAGLLCIKPQLAVLLPAILLQRRFRAALAVAMATVCALGLAGTIYGGWTAWPRFVTEAQPLAGRILGTPYGQTIQSDGVSVFLAARSLGLTPRDAALIQIAATAASMVVAWLLWRPPEVDPVARMAMTVCLTMLATPYGFSYDLVAFSIAVLALGRRAPAWQWPCIAALWVWPGLNATVTKATGVELMPLAMLLAIGLAVPQLRRAGGGFFPASAPETIPE
jgi:hypothetical protein